MDRVGEDEKVTLHPLPKDLEQPLKLDGTIQVLEPGGGARGRDSSQWCANTCFCKTRICGQPVVAIDK